MHAYFDTPTVGKRLSLPPPHMLRISFLPHAGHSSTSLFNKARPVDPISSDNKNRPIQKPRSWMSSAPHPSCSVATRIVQWLSITSIISVLKSCNVTSQRLHSMPKPTKASVSSAFFTTLSSDNATFRELLTWAQGLSLSLTIPRALSFTVCVLP